MAGFEKLGVMPEIIQGIAEMGWELPRDVQDEAIPLILGGGDVLAAAETGTGKTGAFCLPIVQIVHEARRDAARAAAGGASTSAAGGSGGSGMPPCAMSVEDRDLDFAVAPDGLLVQARNEFGWDGGRANTGVFQGRYYFEATVTDEGLCRVGWSTKAANFNLGTDVYGYGFGGTAKKSNNKSFIDYGQTFGQNDTVGCYFDANAWTVSFSKNGSDFGVAFEIPESQRGRAFFPAVVLKNAELKLNFGGEDWTYGPSDDTFVGMAQAEAADTNFAVMGDAEAAGRRPACLIVEPVKELAAQVYDQVMMFKKYVPDPCPSALLCVGGMPTKPQAKALSQGVDIVIGTPGRLASLIESGALDLSAVQFFVLDEADQLLGEGAYEEVMGMYARLPKVSQRLQVLLFSATLHSPLIKQVAQKIMKFPTWVDLKGRDLIPDTVTHVCMRINPKHDSAVSSITVDGVHQNDPKAITTPEGLSEAIKRLKPRYLLALINKYSMDQALIFCRTKLDCNNLERFLTEAGGGGSGMVSEYSCCCLHGDRSGKERSANLTRFKNGEVRFLISTDVAARGIDVYGLPYVINYTLPDTAQQYIHRVGRVGRAEHVGLAISLVGSFKEKVWYHANCRNGGRKCRNVALVTSGGCCIWYDEPGLLREIEELIDEAIPAVEIESLDASDAERFGARVAAKQAAKAYVSHVEELAGTVEALDGLQTRAQASYHGLRTRDWAAELAAAATQ